MMPILSILVSPKNNLPDYLTEEVIIMQGSDGNNIRGYNPFAQSQLQPQPANNNADALISNLYRDIMDAMVQLVADADKIADCLRDMQQDNGC